ncbi:MAG: carbohydrate-binding family 9-like protein [Chitinophagaceae bacterium]|nr:carbohydrate-binding family 9-like protein [Chitinophagaceae bacterium]
MIWLAPFVFSFSGLIAADRDVQALDTTKKEIKKLPVYNVKKLRRRMTIDGNWDKPEWKKIKPLRMTHYMGKVPHFEPKAEAKMVYDDENIYVIFRVKDKFVSSHVTEYNGNVSGDACVEFFFSPDEKFPLYYFNLEVNAGGTPLIFYVTTPWTGFKKLEAEDIRQIEIAHSLPKVVDPEIKEEVTWTLEYRVPLEMLRKFSNVTYPKPGVIWKANFYKTASKTSNPHYLTWAFVDNPKPNFHLPQFFGILKFK